MNNRTTAPYIPSVQTHWSFSDEIAQRKRALDRRQQAVVERAKREVQAILGGVLYHAITGTKPVVAKAKQLQSRKLTLNDLL